MEELPGGLKALVASAWAFRARVEADATVQFQRLAASLEAAGAPARLVQVARLAVEEEARHRGLCDRLARAYGGGGLQGTPEPPPPLAPAGLTGRAALAYAVVAHCCIAETESVATLTLLIPRAGPPEVKQALQAIARDEVEHAQLGWAALTWLGADRLDFLEPWLPAMLEPGAGPLFRAPPAGAEDPRLVAHGVLPAAEKKEVFLEAMEGVVLPGLKRAGIPGDSARRWIAEAAQGARA